jgi:hypothetical protein
MYVPAFLRRSITMPAEVCKLLVCLGLVCVDWNNREEQACGRTRSVNQLSAEAFHVSPLSDSFHVLAIESPPDTR